MILLRGSTRNLTETNQKLFPWGGGMEAGGERLASGLGTCVVWGAGYCAGVNPAVQPKKTRAFTLIELLVVVVIGLLVFFTAWPMHKGVKVRAPQAQCLSHLRQIALGYTLWANDNTNLYPWEVSTNSGGTLELSERGNAVDQFQPLTAYVMPPAILVCPVDRGRSAANSYLGLSNSNLSYFVSLDATITTTLNPSILILAGDRYLENHNQPIGAGLFVPTNIAALSWQKGYHETASQPAGTMAFVDGHSEYLRAGSPVAVFQRQGLKTNRLVFP